jgi:hypothetical protein
MIKGKKSRAENLAGASTFFRQRRETTEDKSGKKRTNGNAKGNGKAAFAVCGAVKNDEKT